MVLLAEEPRASAPCNELQNGLSVRVNVLVPLRLLAGTTLSFDDTTVSAEKESDGEIVVSPAGIIIICWLKLIKSLLNNRMMERNDSTRIIVRAVGAVMILAVVIA